MKRSDADRLSFLQGRVDFPPVAGKLSTPDLVIV